MTRSRSKALLFTLAIGTLAYSLGPAMGTRAQQQPQQQPQQQSPPDVFSSRSQPNTMLKGGVQQNVGCGNPGGGTTTQQPGVGGDNPYCHCSDPVCGGTNRRCYDAAYGTRSVVVSETVMQQLYNATRGAVWIRCGTCGANAICWPRPFYANWVNQCLNAAAAGKNTCPNPPQENFSNNASPTYSPQPRPSVPAACPAVPANNAWPPLVALETFTTQVANAERDALVNVTRQMAPQFDMTRSGEGLRYMSMLLGRLGFSYLAANAPGALRAIATGKPVQLQIPMYGWSPVGGSPNVPAVPPANIAGPPQAPVNLAAPTQLPLGVSLPAFLGKTPRPLQLQEEAASCGFACIKMVADTILRTARPESAYRAMVPQDLCGYSPGVGVSMLWLERVLQNLGIPAKLAQTGQTLQNLQSATQNGYPAIAFVGNSMNVGHFVVVDAVFPDASGNEWVVGRDPFNLAFLDAITRQAFENMGMRNYFVRPAPQFLRDWRGAAVYTSP